MKYRIGLDIGIGSIGWAVVSAEEDGHPARIENFGTRIFPSGEKEKNSESLCKERRGFRGTRRLIRRRSYRKKMLLNHLKNIGFVNNTFYDDLAACQNADVYSLKVKGLDEKLSPAELYKCLVHTCNHRGYRDFYEPSEDDDEAGKNEGAANLFETAFKSSGKRIVSEYLLSEYSENGFVKYRNRDGGTVPYMLVRRTLLQDETAKILAHQESYYPCLNHGNREQIETILFRQRDFEDGPGDPNDKDRRYHGFLETLGKCTYYKDCDRGFRGTVIADVYAVTNTLSQYRFVDKNTGEYFLSKSVAKELVDFLLANAKITITDVKRILKANHFELVKGDGSDENALGKAIKYLGIAKKSALEAGINWENLIGEEQFDPDQPSQLHRIGELISKFQTPRRRQNEMEKAGLDKALIKAFSNKKISGTAAVSYRYMCDAIHAFLDGDIYGNFQANYIKEHAEAAPVERKYKLSPAQIDDPEVRDNRVVFKAINETRKIVNAIIDIYGSPEEIVIEVASELGKSAEMRLKETKRQRDNEKANDAVKKQIREILSSGSEKASGGDEDIPAAMIERYKLFKEQDGKCAYSQKPLGELKDVLENRNRVYEIDHIVPYSLILDNTLNNKMLVFAEENQRKKQQTPLMYMTAEQAKAFVAFTNDLFRKKTISKKKLAYCQMKTLYGPEAEETLNAWKSRNINDTRYITKYIAGLFDQYLLFSGNRAQHVYTVKGAVTQKFRREWFRTSVWGQEEKDRSTYLNHALDALVAANLTKAYIEIGSDALRLSAIYRSHRRQITPEYETYLAQCISKMKKYYGFGEAYTRKLLSQPEHVPAYVPRLSQEVAARFFEGDEKTFRDGIDRLYGKETEFLVPPHMPITSHKQDKKFRGCIADAMPVRLAEVNGEMHKIARKKIIGLTESDLPCLRTDDTALAAQLAKILTGTAEKKAAEAAAAGKKGKAEYTIGDYLKENGLTHFTTPGGQVIRAVSLDKGVFSNYYRKQIDETNFTNISMLKYYCVEVYKDTKGLTRICGIRFVDLVKKNKKLYRKAESLPADYREHVTYLFAGDYVKITDGKGQLKFDGYYIAVHNMNRSVFYFKQKNESAIIEKAIGSKDTICKYSISILGEMGGEIRCSEPLPCIGENGSR